jgi:Secretion system C-terminal sorting domain
VIDYRFFGTTVPNTHKAYNEGKTLVHLVAGYLGVHELWNENVPCGDDKVSDTPIHNSPNYGLFDEYKHISTCLGNPIEMTMNLMDNTDDTALYMFTEGQKMRIQAILSKNGARGKLSDQNKAQCEVIKNIAADPLGGRSTIEQSSVIIYPNPTQDVVMLQIKAALTSPYSIVVYNNLGNIMYQSNATIPADNQPIMLDTYEWQGGMYFFQIRVKEHLYTEKILIAH